MEDKLFIYELVRKVPIEAQKEIKGGRLKGKTDINPMWRIKILTETFGVCGFGWKYIIKEKRLEKGGGNEISAFVDIDLFIKINDNWSEAIPGTGGSSFVANEKENNLYTSDECFKMALTDAISVSCKAIGIGADIYWNADRTKNEDNQNRIASSPSPSEERIIVENYLNDNYSTLQATLSHFNLGCISDASEGQIKSMYQTLKQKKVL